MKRLSRYILGLVAGFTMLSTAHAGDSECEDLRNEAGTLAAQFFARLDELAKADEALDRARAAMNEAESKHDAEHAAMLDAIQRLHGTYDPYDQDNALSQANPSLFDYSLTVPASQVLTNAYLAAVERVNALTNTLTVQYGALVLANQRIELACAAPGDGGTTGSGGDAPVPASPRDVVTNVSECRGLMESNAKRTLHSWGPLVAALDRCRHDGGGPTPVWDFCQGRATDGKVRWVQCQTRTGYEAVRRSLVRVESAQQAACQKHGGAHCEPILVMLIPKRSGERTPHPSELD